MWRSSSQLLSAWHLYFSLLEWSRQCCSTCSLHSVSNLCSSNCWAAGDWKPSESRPSTFSLQGVYGSRLDFRHLSYVIPLIPRSKVKKNSSFIPWLASLIDKPQFEILDCGNMAKKCPFFISVWAFTCKKPKGTSGLMLITVASDDFPGSICA